MYLKFETKLDFTKVAQALDPELAEDDIYWDAENVYEWMYIDLTQLDISLNISREHGWAELDDVLLDLYEDNEAELKRLPQPGPVYVFGCERDHAGYVEKLPDFLPSFLADRLSVDVLVFSGRVDEDASDDEAVAVVGPQDRICR